MGVSTTTSQQTESGESLLLSRRAQTTQRLIRIVGQSFLFLVTAAAAVAVFLILLFILKDALPFFKLRGFREFFTSTQWYPSGDPAEFGALAIFAGSVLVTLGACILAVPFGIAAAVCLSDVLTFRVRQIVKPVIEVLAAIPSVAFGFFALVVFAPALQEHGGHLLAAGVWLVGAPLILLGSVVVGDLVTSRLPGRVHLIGRIALFAVLAGFGGWLLQLLASRLGALTVSSGANALNVSIILGIMALPTVVSVSEDALQAVGRELREGSYAMGATRAETLCLVVIPAAASGICAAVILGVMRAVGETMVVWMASGNAAQIPEPWFNFLEPVRTMTATIAGDMGEADQVTGSARYHVLFALAACLLIFSLTANVVSEHIVQRARRKLGK